MKLLRLLAILFLAAPSAWAAEPAFEIRAVAEHAGPPAQEYMQAADEGRQPERLYLDPEILLDLTALRSASAVFKEADGWVIQVNLTGRGSEQFGEVTTKCLGRRLGMLVNGKLRCSPRVNGMIKGSFEISGNFTADEATSLAADLNAAIAKAASATPGNP